MSIISEIKMINKKSRNNSEILNRVAPNELKKVERIGAISVGLNSGAAIGTTAVLVFDIPFTILIPLTLVLLGIISFVIYLKREKDLVEKYAKTINETPPKA